MDKETVDNLLNKIAAVLEEHTVIFVNQRQALEHILEEVSQLKRRLEKLEASDSEKPSDADFVAEINARLKTISDNLRAKD